MTFGQEIRGWLFPSSTAPLYWFGLAWLSSVWLSLAWPLQEFGSTKGSRERLGTEEEVEEVCSGG